MADRTESSTLPASNVLTSRVDPTSARFEANMRFMADLVSQIHNEEEKIREGGGPKAIERQHAQGRLTARERINLLADPGSFFELCSYAAYLMYEEWGGAPAAGVITGLARVHTRLVMIIANDATVKAGAFFPMTSKKVIRAQNIAIENRIPTIYLVDSAGVFLPLQEDVFPDTDDFGRVFRNNAVMSSMGISQIAAIMGMCVAGGGYLPVMCDNVLMTDGSGLFLAGPALVQAAIGQKVSAEELGGAAMHSAISGTIDFHEPNDEACIARIRSMVEKWGYRRQSPWDRKKPENPTLAAEEIYGIYDSSPGRPYDMKEILARIVDGSRFDEYKAEYGKTVLCGYARIGGFAVGIVANQKLHAHQTDHANSLLIRDIHTLVSMEGNDSDRVARVSDPRSRVKDPGHTGTPLLRGAYIYCENGEIKKVGTRVPPGLRAAKTIRAPYAAPRAASRAPRPAAAACPVSTSRRCPGARSAARWPRECRRSMHSRSLVSGPATPA